MVLAAVAVDPAVARRLSRAGVRDSKRFGAGEKAQQARAELAQLIRAIAPFFAVEVCEVEIVDAYVAQGGLNRLEHERAHQLLGAAPPCKRLIADGNRLFSPLKARFPTLEARDRGESFHVAVAAASVLAKAVRDQLFAAIVARYDEDFGPITGGGYVNEGTLRFVRRYVDRHGQLPPEARKSWPWMGLRETHPQLFSAAEGHKGQSPLPLF